MVHAALEVRGLRRQYRGRGGITHIDLSVPVGALYALIGPNGAGKTTLLQVLAGLQFAEAGQLWVAGEAIPTTHVAPRPGCGFVLDTPWMDLRLTATQWITYVAGLKGVAVAPEAEAWASSLQLSPAVRDTPMQTCSFGTQRKIALWVEACTTTQVLVLDEPLTGLDPSAIDGLHGLLRQWCARGGSVIMATHLLQEAAVVATHVGLLARGEMQRSGTLASVCGSASLADVYRAVVGAA